MRIDSPLPGERSLRRGKSGNQTRKADLTRLTRKALVLTVVVLLALAAGSCAADPPLPDDARLALEQQWDTLSPESAAGLRIVRAWQGKAPANELAPGTPAQMWCVEAELSATPESDAQPDRTVWIVTRPDENAPWSVAMLFTMSSLWPYQACGLAP